MGAVGGRDLDHRQHIADRIQTGAAILVRHLDAHQAVLAKQADVVDRKLAAAIERLGARRDLLLRDPAGDVLYRQLLLGELKIHVALLESNQSVDCNGAGSSQTSKTIPSAPQPAPPSSLTR